MSWTTIELIEEGVEVALGDHIIPVEGISSIHPIVVGMGNASWAGERFTGAVVTEGTSVVLPSSYPQHYVFLLQHADNTWHAYTVTPEAGSATFTHDPAWLTEHTLTYPPAVDTVTPARTLFVLNDGHGLTSTTEPDTLIDQLWVLYSISSVVTPHRVADRPTVDDLDDVTTAGILDGEGLIWSTADNKFIPGPLGGGGVGNVTGPSSAEDNNIAVFDGTTGNIIKDGGYTIAELLAQHQVSVAYFVVDATWMTSASWVYTSGVGINLTGTPVTADLIGSYIVVVVDLVTYRCESYEITSTTAATYDQSYLEDRANDEDVVTTTKALQLSKMIYAVYDYVNAADMVDDVRLGSLYWVGYETGSSGHVRIVPVARDDYDFDDIIPTPLTDYIPKSLIDAKGDLIAGTAADTAARLPVGTDGQVLTANSTKSTGLEWVTLADLIVIPVTFVISQLEGPDELPLEAGLFATFRAPYAFTITDIRASLTTASSSGAVEWDVKKNATSVFSTTLTVDASEESSVTAATPAVISTTAIAADDEITVHVVDEGTDVEGGKVYITGMRLALTATYDSEAFEDAVGAMAGTGLSYDDGAGTISADLSSLIPKSIIDAKGDVIVGTAADTAARLGVGTDGQVLTADSAETSGVKWAAHNHSGTYLPLVANGASVEDVGAIESNVNTVAATGSTETLDLSLYAFHDCTMDQACTFTFSNPAPSGKATIFTLILRGAYAPTLPASVDWAGAAPGYATPSQYVFTTVDGGTTWLGQLVGKGFA